MNQVILFNPRSASYGYRIPNSILQVAASIDGLLGYVLVDGNREKDPWATIEAYMQTGQYRYFGCTVMPGPQLKQAIPFTKRIKQTFPHVVTVWGGYFASNQYATALDSGYVDYIIDGPGDVAFPSLLKAIEKAAPLSGISNLIYREEGIIVRNSREPLLDQDTLPILPYDTLHQFYPMEGYLKRTFLGTRTAAYHSSLGCPFTCSFCAVVPIYNARWKGKSAELIYRDVLYLKNQYGANAVEFHDNNFFVSEKRVAAFSRLIKKEGIQWWGEGRIDTIDKYSDETLAIMREAGCKMIFFGAETSSDAILQQMDKGGTQTTEQVRRFSGRLRRFGIVPEYSFVLGMPGSSPEAVMQQIDQDIAFIKEVKEVNPDTEIIIYLYSPVPTEGSELYDAVKKAGFNFPKKLEDWLSPQWAQFDLRKNPLTPWLTPAMVDKVRNFETVLNAYYPTASDTKLTPFQRNVMRSLATLRYRWNLFALPYELKILQKFWLKYRQPEIEGFAVETV